MDTLGHTGGGTVGLFECHGAGGNQVRDHYNPVKIVLSCGQDGLSSRQLVDT